MVWDQIGRCQQAQPLTADALELVLTLGFELESLDELSCGSGHRDLIAVCDIHDPCGFVDVWAEIVPVAGHSLTRVQPNAHLQSVVT